MNFEKNRVDILWKSNEAHCLYANHASLLDASSALSELNARSDSSMLSE
jgi:hypothetical protein